MPEQKKSTSRSRSSPAPLVAASAPAGARTLVGAAIALLSPSSLPARSGARLAADNARIIPQPQPYPAIPRRAALAGARRPLMSRGECVYWQGLGRSRRGGRRQSAQGFRRYVGGTP